MPLYKQFKTTVNSRIALWLITENNIELKNFASTHNIDLRQNFYLNEQKHNEYLASRIALKIFGENFIVDEKEEKCAPILKNNLANISISHCKKMCAVITNNLKPVGVDVELVTPRILNISRRFMNIDEFNFLAKNSEINLLQQHIIWSAKESIFKKYNQLHLNFPNEIFIENFEINSDGIITSQIKTDIFFCREKIFYKIFDDVVMTHTL